MLVFLAMRGHLFGAVFMEKTVDNNIEIVLSIWVKSKWRIGWDKAHSLLPPDLNHISSDFPETVTVFVVLKLEWHLPLVPTHLPSCHATSPVILTLLLELESLCLGLSTGELFLIDLKGDDVQEVGIVEGGIQAANWSPDAELLALLSGFGSLLLMNMVSSNIREDIHLLFRLFLLLPWHVFGGDAWDCH